MSSSRAALVALLWAGAAVIATAAPVLADTVGIVRGTLTRPDGKPLPGVTVTLAAPGVTLSAVTDSSGHFAFPRVPFGHASLHASTAEGPAEATVDVATGAVVDVALLAAQVIGHASGTSTGVRGTPVSENTIGASQIAALPANTMPPVTVFRLTGLDTMEPAPNRFVPLRPKPVTSTAWLDRLTLTWELLCVLPPPM